MANVSSIGGNGACENTIACPDGIACEVQCDEKTLCRNKTIDCPEGPYACRINCAGEKACENMTINCGAGTCSLTCSGGNGPCENAKLICGIRSCTAKCDNNVKPPKFECGEACSCDNSTC